MKVLAATSNKGKISEISQILSGSGITILTPYDVGIRLDVTEDGSTFLENALKKARAWHAASGLPSLADDSGLCVDALDGRPGVHSARFAGENASDRENYELLLRLMDGIVERTARFVCTMALAVSPDLVITADGRCDGTILTQPVGVNGFGYDPVFLDPESGLSFAQLSDEEKNKRSHRKRALVALRQKLIEAGIIRGL